MPTRAVRSPIGRARQFSRTACATNRSNFSFPLKTVESGSRGWYSGITTDAEAGEQSAARRIQAATQEIGFLIMPDTPRVSKEIKSQSCLAIWRDRRYPVRRNPRTTRRSSLQQFKWKWPSPAREQPAPRAAATKSASPPAWRGEKISKMWREGRGVRQDPRSRRIFHLR